MHSIYSRDSFIGTRLSRRSIVPLTPTIEKPRDTLANCDEATVIAVDSADQSNASPQTSPIRWEPLLHPDKRVPTVFLILKLNENGNFFMLTIFDAQI